MGFCGDPRLYLLLLVTRLVGVITPGARIKAQACGATVVRLLHRVQYPGLADEMQRLAADRT